MNKKHFTLFELMVAVVIIGIFAAMLLPALKEAKKKWDNIDKQEKAQPNPLVEYKVTKLFEIEGSAVYSFYFPRKGNTYFVTVPIKTVILEKPESK